MAAGYERTAGICKVARCTRRRRLILIWGDGPGTHSGVPLFGRIDPTFARASSLESVASVALGTGSLSKEVILMARVIVLPNAVNLAESFSRSVVLDECIDPVHLEDEHSSLQFIERVAWAIQDAEGRKVATP